MIKSMTGFGRSYGEENGYNITVEIKSVNHRFFEFYSRVPRQYAFLEEKLKSFINSKVARGKIECTLTIENLSDDSVEVQVNKPLAKAYADSLRELSAELGLKEDFGSSLISRFPEVLSVTKQEIDEDLVWQSVKIVAENAVNKFISMRETEGEKLKADLLLKCDRILECVSFVESRSPQTVNEYQERLYQKMKEVLESTAIDEQRILAEAAIYSDKVAVDEETVRLRSHIDQFKTFLESEEAIGRKMDFLVQEMNRETNTIGSKCSDVEISRKVVDIKSDIEKIREQIQNIE